jgi:hypothetical protein
MRRVALCRFGLTNRAVGLFAPSQSRGDLKAVISRYSAPKSGSLWYHFVALAVHTDNMAISVEMPCDVNEAFGEDPKHELQQSRR